MTLEEKGGGRSPRPPLGAGKRRREPEGMPAAVDFSDVRTGALQSVFGNTSNGAYDTTELATAAGELLTVLVIDDISGWSWVRNGLGREGWVPSNTIEPVPVS
jgi:hypothetical protein